MPYSMKNINHIILLVISCFFISCIRPEFPNAEADILSCTVDPLILRKDPIIQNNRIQILVKSSTDLTKQAPVFTLTPGATIFPESGEPLVGSTVDGRVFLEKTGGSLKLKGDNGAFAIMFRTAYPDTKTS